VPTSSAAYGSDFVPPVIPVISEPNGAADSQQGVVLDAPTSAPISQDPVIAPTYNWVTLLLVENGGERQIEITPKDTMVSVVFVDLRTGRRIIESDTTLGTDESYQVNSSVRINGNGTVTYVPADGIYHFYARVFGQYGHSGQETWKIVPDDTTKDMSVTFTFEKAHFTISAVAGGREVDFQQSALCPQNCELHFDLVPFAEALPAGPARQQFYAQGLNDYYQFSFPAGWHPVN
jgi:hypothetical protein